jgi:hypothetical protein
MNAIMAAFRFNLFGECAKLTLATGVPMNTIPLDQAASGELTV